MFVFGHRFPGEKLLGFIQRKLRSFDVRRVVRLKEKRPRVHPADPVLGKRCRFQKPPRPLDSREIGRDRVCDREARFKAY